MNRRTASGMVVAGGSVLAAGIIGVPTIFSALAPALLSRSERWRPVGQLEDFPVGAVSRGIVVPDQEWPRPFGELAVFVWRRAENEWTVFSQNCTDLGCPLQYEAGSRCFLCPCHGGIFTQDGRRLAGPPKSPLHRYAHRIRENALEIDLNSVPPAA